MVIVLRRVGRFLLEGGRGNVSYSNANGWLASLSGATSGDGDMLSLILISAGPGVRLLGGGFVEEIESSSFSRVSLNSFRRYSAVCRATRIAMS